MAAALGFPREREPLERTPLFSKVLVANRGEIAVRVVRALREMGVASVAVYSDPDADALHARLADEAYALGGVAAGETYLDVEKLLRICRESGAEAVHPGYGFLSENAAFAEALEAAGIQLIGPTADVIRAMGDKVEARRRMQEAGVPLIPGWDGGAGTPAAAAAAIGYPILVKAAAGGGGKGMRRVDRPEELEAALEAASQEAQKAFSDGRVYLEKYVTSPRHVEIQVFGDHHGSVVHLFERECSIQRRHQKIVEESPSPALDPELRRRMGEAAVAAARAIGYRNAGTVEFILDTDGQFYFLEVNTRLQVEHPVTEWVTGLDLVRLQVRIAAGEPLPFSQEDLRQTGHALECRVYAEDPDRQFLPSTGTLRVYREPDGPGVRVDSGVQEGSEITVHYDPLLAKLTVWAEDRAAALARMDAALSRFVVLGVRTNLSFLRRLLRHPEFQAGRLDTHFLERYPLPSNSAEPPVEALAAAALVLGAGEARGSERKGAAPVPSPWLDGGGWRLGAGSGEVRK